MQCDGASPPEPLASARESLCEGVWKYRQRAGSGEPACDRARVTVHYEAFGAGEAEAFDSTRQRGQPLVFTLGEGEVLACLERALSTMRRGEIARIDVSTTAAEAYGDQVRPLGVPPGDVSFVLELLEWHPPAERDRGSALRCKEQGNAAYKLKDYALAERHYRGGLCIMERVPAPSPEDERALDTQARVDLLNNLANCCLGLDKPANALALCEETLLLSAQNPKALFRRAKALRSMQGFAPARADLEAVVLLTEEGQPSLAKAARKELAALGKAEKAARKAEHEAFGRTFSTVGITLPRTDTRDTSLAV